MKYFSLFSGIGGFEYGFPADWECVGYSEVDKYAQSVYAYHYPNHEGYGDATRIDTRSISDFDLLCAGFPCQSFSVAGRRKGLADSRGTLFFEIARILTDKRPRYFLLENVKGLLSHDDGKTFAQIIGILADIGYLVQWQVLNSKHFGVPQNRERIFIVGHLRGTSRPEVFPIGEGDGQVNASRNGEDCVAGSLGTRSGDRSFNGSTTVIYDVPRGKNKGGFSARSEMRTITQSKFEHNTMILHTNKSGNVAEHTAASCALRSGASHNYQVVALTEARTEEAKAIRREAQRNGKDYCPRRGKELVERTDGLGNCVTGTQSKEMFGAKDRQIRRLTPLECERLQGFPEIEKYVIIEVCKEDRRKNVNAESQNRKSQKLVGDVGNDDPQENVQYVARFLNTKNQQTNRHVLPDVLIDCAENGIEIYNQEKLLLSAKNAERKNWCHPHIKIGDFVQLLVGINIIRERIAKLGEVGFPQNGRCSTHLKNGLKPGRLFGNEMMRPVGDAENDLTILKELLKFTTLSHSSTENLEQKLQTLFLFVIRAITGYIPKRILAQSIFTIGVKTKVGYTYGVSDTQRYKMLGNAVTTTVIQAISERF